ncbi:MBL fold metallo-hydrolase [Lacrimispora sp.]|uniref:MBL fold metallo-hydrolase n=1 Tax=Lacrimispora sp. TaxID=2719234 RepID=UPI0028A9C3E2|nr:MBL fold metallo-hydrolase [Lacrimispora sp.]
MKESGRNDNMFMERTINAIGQGAFYTEQFCNGIKVVYDCGSTTSLKLLQKAIDSRFEDDSKIDLVFISHFHSDHINGLPYLLQKCKVDKMVVPYLKQNEIIIHLFELIIYCLKNNINSEEEMLLARIIESAGDNRRDRINIDGAPQIIPVVEEYSEQEINIDDIPSKISSGCSIIINFYQWRYVPYNYRQSFYYPLLEGEIIKALGKMPSSYDEIKCIMEDKRTKYKIINVYKNVFGKKYLNESSMVIFSGARGEDYRICKMRGMDIKMWRGLVKSGCLYTGDINISDGIRWGWLKKNYKSIWDSIQFMQVPHHGSTKNFFKDIAKENFEFFLCAGKKNTYGHPDFGVIKEILFNGKELSIVSEDSKTEITYYIMN